MATFNRTFRPVTLPAQTSFDPMALGDPSDSAYDAFLTEAASLFGEGRAGQVGGWNPGQTNYGSLGAEDRSVVQAENRRLESIYGRARALGINGLPAVQQIMQQRAEMRARGVTNPPSTSGGVSPDAQRYVRPTNPPPRINDYRAPVPSKPGVGVPGPSTLTLHAGRMGKEGQPFGQQSFGTGFGGSSTGFGGFSNPGGRSRYDKQR